MLGFLLIGALLSPGAALCDELDALDPHAVAEYRRLSDQLGGLVEKQIWAGAERTYQQMLATGVEPGFEELLAGAHTARQLGEIGLTYERLVAAARLREDREVVEWLWTLDQEYGRVVLIVESEAAAALTPQAMPFAPDARRCIEVAQTHLGEARRFEGMLPVGTYDFGGQRFTVSPGGVAVELRVAPEAAGRRWGRRPEAPATAPPSAAAPSPGGPETQPPQEAATPGADAPPE